MRLQVPGHRADAHLARHLLLEVKPGTRRVSWNGEASKIGRDPPPRQLHPPPLSSGTQRLVPRWTGAPPLDSPPQTRRLPPAADRQLGPPQGCRSTHCVLEVRGGQRPPRWPLALPPLPPLPLPLPLRPVRSPLPLALPLHGWSDLPRLARLSPCESPLVGGLREVPRPSFAFSSTRRGDVAPVDGWRPPGLWEEAAFGPASVEGPPSLRCLGERSPHFGRRARLR